MRASRKPLYTVFRRLGERVVSALWRARHRRSWPGAQPSCQTHVPRSVRWLRVKTSLRTPRAAGNTLLLQELSGLLKKQLWILVDGAMGGIWIDDELSIR
jgi:hypothetical protein